MYRYPHDAIICNKPYKLSILINPDELEKGYQHCQTAPEKDEGLLFIFSKEKQHYLHMRNVGFDLQVLCFNSDKKLVGKFIMPSESNKLYRTPVCKYIVECSIT